MIYHRQFNILYSLTYKIYLIAIIFICKAIILAPEHDIITTSLHSFLLYIYVTLLSGLRAEPLP